MAGTGDTNNSLLHIDGTAIGMVGDAQSQNAKLRTSCCDLTHSNNRKISYILAFDFSLAGLARLAPYKANNFLARAAEVSCRKL